MNAAISSSEANASYQAWAERNQLWLSQRFARWRDHLDQAPDRSRERAEAVTGDDDFQPAAAEVARLFGLSVFERELLVLAAGMEIDTALRDAVVRAQSTRSTEPAPLMFSLALKLLPQPHWDAISPLLA